MSFQVSPGINITEIDLTTIVPAVSTSTAAIAGIFQWGPVSQKTLIDSEITLTNLFGKPNSNCAETWFTAANYLAYGNSLQLVRVVDGAFNAYVNTGSVANISILNLTSYENYTIPANAEYIAKYPGALGDSLMISVCDSPTAYSVALNATTLANATFGNTDVTGFNMTINTSSNVATVTVIANTAGAANDATSKLFTDLIANGDFLSIGNTSVGFNNMQVTGWTAGNTEVVNSGIYTTTSTVNLGAYFNSSANFSGNNVIRNWQFYNKVSGAPAQSYTALQLGISNNDGIHVVVLDSAGKFTGHPGQILEIFSNLSRGTDAKDDSGASVYYKNVLQNASQYVWYGNDGANAPSNSTVNVANSTNFKATTAQFVGGTDGNSEANCSLSALTLGYDQFKSPLEVDISLVLQGKARGLTPESSDPSSLGTDYSTLSNYLISNIVEARKDCVLFVSPAYPDVVGSLTPLDNIVAFTDNLNIATSYAAMDSGYKYQYDKYNDLYRWIPLNGDIAGLCAYTDYVRDPWWSPAGFNRGAIKNVVKLAFNPSHSDRDVLYQAYVNPVVSFPGRGVVLYGDKTLLGRPSAFDRINVRRLFIVLEKAIAIAAQNLLFEFNNTFTQNTFKNLVIPYLRDIQGRQGIYDFRVVCDGTNNTPFVVDSNQFVGDIYIKPARSINFIQLNFIAVGTSVDFNEIVGNV